MPPGGGVAALVAAHASSVNPVVDQDAGVGSRADVSRIGRTGGVWKRIRLTKKTPVFRVPRLDGSGQPIPGRCERMFSHGGPSGGT